MIYRYLRLSTPGPNGATYFHAAGPAADAPPVLTELATLNDGYTYLALAPEATLPDQPAEVVLEPVELTPALRVALAQASAVLRRLDEQVVAMIRAHYSVEDEIKMLRIAPSPETEAWNEHVEHCRQWGREQRAAIGFE